MKGDNLSDRCLDFAARIIRLFGRFPKSQVGRHFCGQLLRSGTAVGANYEEARGAESRADFIHKANIAWKEARESCYWLRLVQRCELVKPALLEELVQEAEELSAIFSATVATAKRNNQKVSPNNSTS